MKRVALPILGLLLVEVATLALVVLTNGKVSWVHLVGGMFGTGVALYLLLDGAARFNLGVGFLMGAGAVMVGSYGGLYGIVAVLFGLLFYVFDLRKKGRVGETGRVLCPHCRSPRVEEIHESGEFMCVDCGGSFQV